METCVYHKSAYITPTFLPSLPFLHPHTKTKKTHFSTNTKLYSTNHNHQTTPMCVVCKTIQHTYIVSVTHRPKHPPPCHAMPCHLRQDKGKGKHNKQPKPLRASLQARSGNSACTKSTSGSSLSTRSTPPRVERLTKYHNILYHHDYHHHHRHIIVYIIILYLPFYPSSLVPFHCTHGGSGPTQP